jgi:hypothetical protein
LTLQSFARAPKLEEIKFEPGCRIRKLESHTFGECVRIRSICIPASVEVICAWLFAPVDGSCLNGLCEVTFERGSKLHQIEGYAFAGCVYVESICLPASLELMDGWSLADTEFKEITVEAGNPYFKVKKPCLVDSTGTRLIRHFGAEREVIIPDEIETLGGSCFTGDLRVYGVTFGPMSKAASIEDNAFMQCCRLRSINIPAAITLIPIACFSSCSALEVVSFCGDSQLLTIGAAAFSSCGLASISLPASLEVIGERSFQYCRKLAAVIVPADSKLVRIEAGAFEKCSTLTALFIPPLVEFVGEACFTECSALCSLTFAPGCHLRQLLDLPPVWPGFHDIPDSVEDLAFKGGSRRTHPSALLFGDESRLIRVRAGSEFPGPRRSFLRVSSRSLKIFRSTLEFEL